MGKCCKHLLNSIINDMKILQIIIFQIIATNILYGMLLKIMKKLQHLQILNGNFGLDEDTAERVIKILNAKG